MAIGLNENDPRALAVYGHVQSFLLHDYERAMLFLDRAIEAGPSAAMAWTMSGATCGYIGNGPLAVERAEHGVRLAPQDAYRFWHEAVLGQAHYINGNYDEAAVWGRRAIGRNGAMAFSLRILIAIWRRSARPMRQSRSGSNCSGYTRVSGWNAMQGCVRSGAMRSWPGSPGCARRGCRSDLDGKSPRLCEPAHRSRIATLQ